MFSITWDVLLFAIALLAYLFFGLYVFFFQADILSALSVEYPVSLKGSAQNLAAQDGPDDSTSASRLTKPGNHIGASTDGSRPSKHSSASNSTKAATSNSSADSGNVAQWTMRQRVHGPNST